jgi:WD40 repeat protein
MPLSLRPPCVVVAAFLLSLSPLSGQVGEPGLPKPIRLGRPAPQPKLPGLWNLPSIAFSRDGKRLAWVYGESTRDGERGFVEEGRLVMEVWDVQKRRLLQQMRPSDNLCWACSGVRFNPSGAQLLLGTWRGVRVDLGGRPGSYLVNKVRVWDVDGEREVGEFPAEDGSSNESPQAFFIHPKGDRITIAQAKVIRVLECASGKTVETHKLPMFIGSSVFSPDGKLLASVTDKADLRIWRVEDAKDLRRMKGMPLTFSPNGKVVATQQEGKIVLLEVATGREERAFSGQAPHPARACCFSPDGKLLAWNDAGKLTIVERATGRVLASVQTQPGGLAFSPDGNTLALGCTDSSALLWDVSGLRQRK